MAGIRNDLLFSKLISMELIFLSGVQISQNAVVRVTKDLNPFELKAKSFSMFNLHDTNGEVDEMLKVSSGGFTDLESNELSSCINSSATDQTKETENMSLRGTRRSRKSMELRDVFQEENDIKVKRSVYLAESHLVTKSLELKKGDMVRSRSTRNIRRRRLRRPPTPFPQDRRDMRWSPTPHPLDLPPPSPWQVNQG